MLVVSCPWSVVGKCGPAKTVAARVHHIGWHGILQFGAAKGVGSPFSLPRSEQTPWIDPRRTEKTPDPLGDCATIARMSTDLDRSATTRERQWFIASRWQEFEGEARANLLRIIGVGAFYIIELINHGVHLGALQLPAVVDDRFHQAMTWLAVAWTMLALVTLVCLRQRVLPAALKFATTGCDIVLMTSVLMIADGPRSPLVIGYFLIIALAALRLSRGLILMATLGSMAAYVSLLGYVKYCVTDERATVMSVPRYWQMIMLVGLALFGITLGQVIRRVRLIANDFARRLEQQRIGGSAA